METIRGRKPFTLDLAGLHTRLENYNRIILDLGTGDGKFAFHHARAFPSHFVIGVDSCRENLCEYSRMDMSNLLYLIARAQSLPDELTGLISHITINFPWGSLLASLLNSDEDLFDGLEAVSQVHAKLDIYLNGGALAEVGTTLEEGTLAVFNNLQNAGWQVKTPLSIDACALRNFPSTWAKRLAFGRDPRAIQLNAHI